MLNLLPLPPLDGGQAVIALVEGVSGRRLSDAVRLGISLVGLLAIVALLVLTLVNDVGRIWH